MEYGYFIWFSRLDGLGEDAVEIHSCTRFIISKYNTDTVDPYQYNDLGITYYRTPSNRWIEHRAEDDVGEVDGETRMVRYDSYHERHPQTAAHQLLRHKPYNLRLPEELEPFRSFGDPARYQAWFSEISGQLPGPGGDQAHRSPRWDGKRVYYGTHLCKEFARRARSQVKILERFQSMSWSKTVTSPIREKKSLKDTIDTMNKWPESVIVFQQDNLSVSWSIKRDKPKSAKIS